MRKRLEVLLNIVLFKIGWLTAVISAAHLAPMTGVLVMSAIVALHVFRAQRSVMELALVMTCAAIGALYDSLLVAAGWVTYPSGLVFERAAPYWIAVMWMLFATTLNVSLRPLRRQPLLAAVTGLAGGPLAYVIGERLGGVVLVDPAASLLALAGGWCMLLPLMLALSSRLDGMRPDPAAWRAAHTPSERT